MIISVEALSWLISIATLVSAITPVVLIVLWLKDWVKGKLW